MAWAILVVAGVLEIGWAVGLKYTDGFTRPVPSILTIAAIILSMGLLSLATRELPIGTAYAVWVGIGAAGAAIMGVILFGEAVTPGKVISLMLLLVAIVGLKISTPDEPVTRAPTELVDRELGG